ncbi:hypothetical protein N7539_006539 [Penicillium diatomitis]|uniref:N-acetyltransferase domain-containing protein n=1 Tax=Penicillium diatomitis TaxID=2819901 RepID=A0A9W9X397_9EURO|nr:uncharacterized protein N7539_006539 [Penicillium diatomitis]KAJ5483093.1 hypothetical protein N7539_006539 [Penicillium diatomitis]
MADQKQHSSSAMTHNSGETSPKPIPELSTYVTTDPQEVTDAHRLVADSVAQQRQLAARAIIFHPVWLGAMLAVIAVIYKIMYHERSDLALVGTTGAGCVMAGLMVVRVCTGGYIDHAERVGTRAWLEGTDEHQDAKAQQSEQKIIVTKFGETIIGALIVKKVRDGRNVRGVIRGWTVLQRYRGKGVGKGLLEEAVQLCQRNGWKNLEFDAEHANAKRILPAIFDGPFEKREMRARRALEKSQRRK